MRLKGGEFVGSGPAGPPSGGLGIAQRAVGSPGGVHSKTGAPSGLFQEDLILLSGLAPTVTFSPLEFPVSPVPPLKHKCELAVRNWGTRCKNFLTDRPGLRGTPWLCEMEPLRHIHQMSQLGSERLWRPS